MSIQKIYDSVGESEKYQITIDLDFLKKITFKNQLNTNVRD